MRTIRSEMRQTAREDAGFTLVELLVAAAIFMIISAASFSLLAQHQPIFNQQQNLGGSKHRPAKRRGANGNRSR